MDSRRFQQNDSSRINDARQLLCGFTVKCDPLLAASEFLKAQQLSRFGVTIGLVFAKLVGRLVRRFIQR